MYLYIHSIIIAILYVYIYVYIHMFVDYIVYILYMYVCLHMCQNLLQPGMRHHNPQRIIALRSCPRRGMEPPRGSSFEAREMSTVHLFTCWENAMINGIS